MKSALFAPLLTLGLALPNVAKDAAASGVLNMTARDFAT